MIEFAIDNLIKQWHEEGTEYFQKTYPNLDYDVSERKSFKMARKYIYLDEGHSGAFLIDREDRTIWRIKAYGVKNPKKFVGVLGEVTGKDLARFRWY